MTCARVCRACRVPSSATAERSPPIPLRRQPAGVALAVAVAGSMVCAIDPAGAVRTVEASTAGTLGSSSLRSGFARGYRSRAPSLHLKRGWVHRDAEPDKINPILERVLPGRGAAKPIVAGRLRSVSSIGVSTSSRKRMNLFHSGSRMLHTTQTYLVVLATQVALSVCSQRISPAPIRSATCPTAPRASPAVL